MADIKEFDALLARHDWHWRFTDDPEVARAGKASEDKLDKLAQTSPNHTRLFQAYTEYNQSMPHEGRHEYYVEMLNASRVANGATTRAELDELDRRKAEQVRQRELAAYQELVDYDLLCRTHNWYYWRGVRTEQPQYLLGSEERGRLLHKAPTRYPTGDSPYLKLFRAWAAFKVADDVFLNTVTKDDQLERQRTAAWDKLRQVRLEVGLKNHS